MPGEFRRDDDWQRDMRDRVLAPGFYGSYAKEGRYVFIDKGRLASRLQREYAVDTIVQGKKGGAVCIEEKIVRPRPRPLTAFSLETHSCTVPGREKTGWMEYGKADFLLWAFAQYDDSLEVYLMDFPKLQAWFWPIEDSFPIFGPMDQINRSMGRVVPIDRVREAIGCWHRRICVPAMEAA